jgi:hypothetical protein
VGSDVIKEAGAHSVPVDLRHIPNHHNRLAVPGSTRIVCINHDIEKVGIERINDPTRFREPLVPTPTNVVTAVFSRAVRRRKKTSVFRSKIVLRDGSTVLTLQYIRGQDLTIGIAALDCPVDNSVLLGWALSPSGNPPGGDAVVLVEKAPPICTAILIAEHRLPLRFEEEPPHEAIPNA